MLLSIKQVRLQFSYRLNVLSFDFGCGNPHQRKPGKALVQRLCGLVSACSEPVERPGDAVGFTLVHGHERALWALFAQAARLNSDRQRRVGSERRKFQLPAIG